MRNKKDYKKGIDEKLESRVALDHEIDELRRRIYISGEEVIEQTLKLIKKEELIHLILDNLNQVCYLADIEANTILFANKHAKNLFGDDIEGQKCYSALYGFNKICDFCNNENLEEGETVELERYHPTLDKFYRITNTLVRYKGRLVRLEFAKDITKHKKYAQENKKFYQAFNKAPFGIILINEKGHVNYANNKIKGKIAIKEGDKLEELSCCKTEEIKNYISDLKNSKNKEIKIELDGEISHVTSYEVLDNGNSFTCIIIR